MLKILQGTIIFRSHLENHIQIYINGVRHLACGSEPMGGETVNKQQHHLTFGVCVTKSIPFEFDAMRKTENGTRATFHAQEY